MPTINERHVKQLSKLERSLHTRGWDRALAALTLVKGLEEGKTRKDGRTPKFHHQVSVARLLYTLIPHLEHPEQTITAAFLHDVLEDYSTEFDAEALNNQFGSDIAVSVLLLTKKYKDTVKTYENYFSDMAFCPVASIVKLADRAHNIHTMQGVFALEKQAIYTAEVSQWFLPMLRQARRQHPRQYDAYENLKIMLRCQVNLIRTLAGQSA